MRVVYKKQRKPFLKSVCGLFLSAALLLAGCAPDLDADPAAPESQPVPMGRYAETEITPAVEGLELDWTLCLLPQPGGVIDYYVTSPATESAGNVSKLHHLRSEDNGQTWEERPIPWLSEINKICGYEGGDPWFMDARNGTLYCVFPDTKSHMRLFTVSEEGAVAEVRITLWQRIADTIIETFRVTEGGRIGVGYFDERAVLYTPDGKKHMDRETIWGETVAFEDDVIYGWDGNNLSVDKLKASKSLEFPEIISAYQPRFEAAGGNLYILSNNGVYTYNDDSSVFEILMKGSYYQFGSPDCTVRDFRYEPEADQFYVALSTGDNGPQRLFRYEYDPYGYDSTAPLPPQEQLSIFSVRYIENVNVAIQNFKMHYRNVDVQYINSWNQSGGSEEEFVAALESELVRSEGPDVILLDRMDAPGLVDQGLFLPLSPPEGCFGNVLDAYRRGDNYYALPARFDADLPCQASIDGLFWEGNLPGRPRREPDDASPAPQEGRYMPLLVAAVNAHCENEETARAFVASLFTEKEQKRDFRYGFPVHKTTFLQTAEQRIIRLAIEDGLRPVNIRVTLEPGLTERCEALTRMTVTPPDSEGPSAPESP